MPRALGRVRNAAPAAEAAATKNAVEKSELDAVKQELLELKQAIATDFSNISRDMVAVGNEIDSLRQLVRDARSLGGRPNEGVVDVSASGTP